MKRLLVLFLLGIATYLLMQSTTVCAQEKANLICRVNGKDGKAVDAALLLWHEGQFGPLLWPLALKGTPQKIEVLRAWAKGGSYEFRDLLSGIYTLVAYDILGDRCGSACMIDVRPNVTTTVQVAMVSSGKDCLIPSVTYDRMQAERLELPGRFMAAMHEPPLCQDGHQQGSSEESYLILCMPSFDNELLVQVVVHEKGNATVTCKEMANTTAGNEPGLIVGTRVLEVSAARVRGLLEKAETEFWQQPPEVQDPVVGDATEWVIEGRKGGACKIIARSTPMGLPREFGESLMKLAGVKCP